LKKIVSSAKIQEIYYDLQIGLIHAESAVFLTRTYFSSAESNVSAWHIPDPFHPLLAILNRTFWTMTHSSDANTDIPAKRKVTFSYRTWSPNYLFLLCTIFLFIVR
jgi:hypothetical protein